MVQSILGGGRAHQMPSLPTIASSVTRRAVILTLHNIGRRTGVLAPPVSESHRTFCRDAGQQQPTIVAINRCRCRAARPHFALTLLAGYSRHWISFGSGSQASCCTRPHRLKAVVTPSDLTSDAISTDISPQTGGNSAGNPVIRPRRCCLVASTPEVRRQRRFREDFHTAGGRGEASSTAGTSRSSRWLKGSGTRDR